VTREFLKSTSLTLITAIAAVMFCGLQPSLHVESAAVRDVDGTMALAMTRPLRLTPIHFPRLSNSPSDDVEVRRPQPSNSSQITWSD
jgi:hypothetical protein